MFGIMHDQNAELAAMLQVVADAMAVHVKNGGIPPRDAIAIPNLERLMHFLKDPHARYTHVMLMAVFEATLVRHEPYVQGLEQAGLLPAGFLETVCALMRRLRAQKEKKMGLHYMQSQARMFSSDGSARIPMEASALYAERSGLASVMQKIIDAAEAFRRAKNFNDDGHTGLAATRRLKTALEDLEADRLYLVFCLGNFESTMMGYSDEVLGLEEHQFLPKGFAGMTIERVRRLREEVCEPVSSEIAGR